MVSLNSKESEFIWTNDDGQVQYNTSTPVAIEISHLDYESQKDSIYTNSSYTYALKPKSLKLNEVIVTGQYEPITAKNTVYKVHSISKKRIENQAANDLQGVLKQELNIQFQRDNATGNANFEMQGLSGQYVKVLVDGIPLTGKGGTQNAIDLNQIDINTIEKIEIVEGPMAVNYGADALAGVINIITKKSTHEKLSVGLTIHEETVGNEYSWFKEGVHSPSLQISEKLTDHLIASVSSRQYVFGGWVGNGTARDREWYPKNQWLHHAKISFLKENFDIIYSTQFMREELLNLGEINDSSPLKDPFSLDKTYETKRWLHQLQASFDLGTWNLHSANSFTNYDRTTSEYQTNSITKKESLTSDSKQDTVSYKDYFSRNTIQGNLFTSGRWKTNAQLGVEF